MQHHFESIEADWARYYARDLAQDLYGVNCVGWRYINSLLTWLPADAALWRSMGSAWSDEKELLAVNIEVLDALRRSFIIANSKKGAKIPDAVHIDRPGAKTHVKKTGTTLEELMNVMKMPVRKKQEVK